METVTYLIESQEVYKIGKTTNLKKRLINYHTHNPCFKLLHTIEGDFEGFLIEKYKNRRYKGEWFTLTPDEVEELIRFDYSLVEILGFQQALLLKRSEKKILETAKKERKTAKQQMIEDTFVGVVEDKGMYRMIVNHDAIERIEMFDYETKELIDSFLSFEDIREKIGVRPLVLKTNLVGYSFWCFCIHNEIKKKVYFKAVKKSN